MNNFTTAKLNIVTILFYLGFIMQDLSSDPTRCGTTELPHTMKDLRKMKHRLLDGCTLILKHHLETVKVVNGPYEHKRYTDNGLVISVKLAGEPSGDLAKWIDKEKYVYS